MGKIIKLLTHPIFILFVFNIIFFYKPIFFGLYLSPADALQRFPSFNLSEFYAPKNSLLFDPVTQFQPWYKYAFIDKGNLLWNSNNSGGVPFLANSQSAIFFPISIVFKILDIRVALTWFYFLKLFSIGLFTYLFLRELGINKYASLIASTAFNFAGFNIVFLLWPQTNVVIFLPLLLLLLEKLFNNSWSYDKLFISLSLAISFTIFAGHPETIFQVFLIFFLYFIFRIKISRVAYLIHPQGELIKIKVFLLSLITGFIISGIVLIPFTEYLLNSHILYDRVSNQQGLLLPIYSFIYNIFPNISGNPSTQYYRPLISNSNYNELTGAYLGPLIVFSSLVSVLFLSFKKRKSMFFTLLSLALIPFIYEVPLFSSFTRIISKIVGNTRLLFVVGFSQSILAAKFFEELPRLKLRKSIAWVVIILTILISVTIIFIFDNFGPKILSSFDPKKVLGFISYEKKQVIFLALTFIAGITLIFMKKYWKKPQIAAIGVSVLVFMQTGLLNINYNPAIDQKYFYPINDDIKALQQLPKGKYIELGGDYVIPSDINLWYGLENVHNYDALDIREYKELFNKYFPQKTQWDTILNADPKALDKFGVKYVLSYTDIDKKIVNKQLDVDKLSEELASGSNISQEFIADFDSLYAIRVLPANFNRSNKCNFQFILQENQKEIFEKTYFCNEVSDKIFFQIDFPEINKSKGKTFSFAISVLDASSGNSIAFWQNYEGQIVFQTIFNEKENKNLKLIRKGKFNIYENTSVLPEYYLVNPDENSITSLKIEASVTTRKIISVSPNHEGILASTNAYYPGWNVYVDSKRAKIVMVNKAFQGVYIPKGTRVVEFIYDPDSFYFGVFLSLIGVLMLFVVSVKLNKL